MAGNEFFCTVKLDEDDWKAIERAIMSIEKRLERVEAILDARGLDWDHPRVEDDHFVGASKMVADEPTKEAEPEHLAGPKPDPGEGYRILSKDPLEELQEGDEGNCLDGTWGASDNARTHKRQSRLLWYRRKIEPAKPAWEPKVGDWVRVTRPDDWIEWEHPCWAPQMHQFDGKVGKIESDWGGRFHICGFAWPSGLQFIFHRDWLSPAEPPAIDKPPEPEYREPVLPADYKMACEFSDNGSIWASGRLCGWRAGSNWISTGGVCWRHCRIKKDA